MGQNLFLFLITCIRERRCANVDVGRSMPSKPTSQAKQKGGGDSADGRCPRLVRTCPVGYRHNESNVSAT